MSNLIIRWKNAESKGWVDTIPMGLFRNIETRGSTHQYKQGQLEGSCGITTFIFDKIAILDYGRDQREANEENLFIGQSIIIFDNNRRLKPTAILWRDEDNGDVFDSLCDFEIVEDA